MNRTVTRRGFLALMAGATCTSSGLISDTTISQALAQSGDPVAMTAEIFNAYKRDQIPKVPYTPAVRARMIRMNVGMEADIILQAQDVEVKDYTVQPVSRGADRAVVDARFLSFGRAIHARFDWRVVDGKWMIADFRHIAGVENKTHLRRELKLPPLR